MRRREALRIIPAISNVRGFDESSLRSVSGFIIRFLTVSHGSPRIWFPEVAGHSSGISDGGTVTIISRLSTQYIDVLEWLDVDEILKTEIYYLWGAYFDQVFSDFEISWLYVRLELYQQINTRNLLMSLEVQFCTHIEMLYWKRAVNTQF